MIDELKKIRSIEISRKNNSTDFVIIVEKMNGVLISEDITELEGLEKQIEWMAWPNHFVDNSK